MADCIEASGSDKHKYPRVWINGKGVSAHRVAYIKAHGPIPDGMFVLHSSDNKKCVNPDHLHLGTHRDNMREGVERDRFRKGDQLKWAKLDAVRVRLIRQLLDEGMSQDAIASLFGVSQVAVSKIKRKVSWRHVI